jgi:hypothetical protein
LVARSRPPSVGSERAAAGGAVVLS